MLDSNLEQQDPIEGRFLAVEKQKESIDSQLNDIWKRNGIGQPTPSPTEGQLIKLPQQQPQQKSTTDPQKQLPEVDLGKYAADMVKQVPTGVASAVQEMGNAIIAAANWADLNAQKLGITHDDYVPNALHLDFADKYFPQAETFPGKMVHDIVQFSVPFLTGMSAVRGVSTIGNYGKGIAVGAAVNFSALKPHEQRLSNLIQRQPELANWISEYLATDPKDTELEGRLKNSIEGIALGVVGESLFMGLRAMKGMIFGSKAGLSGAEKGVANATAEEAGPTTSTASMELQNAAKQSIPDLPGFTTNMSQPISGDRLVYQGVASGNSGRPSPSNWWTINPKVAMGYAERKGAGGEIRVSKLSDFPSHLFSDSEGNQISHQDYFSTTDNISIADTNKIQIPINKTISAEDFKKIISQHESPISPTSSQVIDAAKQGEGAIPKSEAIPPPKLEVPPPEPKAPPIDNEVPKDIPLSLTSQSEVNQISEMLRLDKYDLVNNADKVIATVQKRFAGSIDEARRGVLTTELTKKLASETGLTLDHVLAVQKGTVWPIEKVEALRQLYTGFSNHITELMAPVLTGKATEAELGNFIETLNVFRIFHEKTMGLRAESGRSTLGWKSFAGMPDAVRMDAMRQQIAAYGNREGLQEAVQALRDAMQLKPGNKTAALVRVAEVSKFDSFKNASLSTFYNLLLSNPKTYIANMTNNASALGLYLGEHAIAPLLGNELTYAEVAARYGALGRGTVEGLQLAKNFFKTGQSPFGSTKIADSLAGASVKAVESSMENKDPSSWMWKLLVPAQHLEAADTFYKGIYYRSALEGLATRDAIKKGLTGGEYSNYIAKMVSNPSEELHVAALKEAQDYTFTNKLTGSAEGFDNMVKKMPGLRVLVPFRRTNLNLAQFSLNRTPFGLVIPNSRLRQELAAGGATEQLAKAKLGLGISMMSVFATLAYSGIITGRGPSNPQARKEKDYVTGWKPYSILIGDKYYQYDRMDPMKSMMGMAADMTEWFGQRVDDKDYPNDQLVITAVSMIAQDITPSFAVDSFNGIIDAIQNKGVSSGGKKLLENLVTGPLPGGLIRQATRSWGNGIKKDTAADMSSTNQTWDEIVNKVNESLGRGGDLPDALNMWGKEIYYPKGWGSDLISPISTTRADKSPIAKEIIRLGLTQGPDKPIMGQNKDLIITMPQRVLQFGSGISKISVQLSPKEYHDYVKLSAGIGLQDLPPLYDFLNDQAKKGFPAAEELSRSDNGRRTFITTTINKYRNAAKAHLLNTNRAVMEKFINAKTAIPDLYKDQPQDLIMNNGGE